MTGKKKKKPEKPKPWRPRNPFAGRRQTGAGFHEEKKYGKKERRQGKDEADQSREQERGD